MYIRTQVWTLGPALVVRRLSGLRPASLMPLPLVGVQVRLCLGPLRLCLIGRCFMYTLSLDVQGLCVCVCICA